MSIESHFNSSFIFTHVSTDSLLLSLMIEFQQWGVLCWARLTFSAWLRLWKHLMFMYLLLHQAYCWWLQCLDIRIFLIVLVSGHLSVCLGQSHEIPRDGWYIILVYLRLIFSPNALQILRQPVPCTRIFLIFFADLNRFVPGLFCVHTLCVKSVKASNKITGRKIENSVRARTQPSFTLFLTSNGSKSSLKLTDSFIPVCKTDMNLTKGYPSLHRMFHSMSLFPVLKAFMKLTNITLRVIFYSMHFSFICREKIMFTVP